MAQHPNEIARRLHKIEGQISGIRRMYEEGRACIDVLDQISAARAGLKAAGLAVLDEHVDGCLAPSGTSSVGADGNTATALAAIRRWIRSV